MENKIKRPCSVWIAQILLAIFVLMFLGAFLMAISDNVAAAWISIVLVLYDCCHRACFCCIVCRSIMGNGQPQAVRSLAWSWRLCLSLDRDNLANLLASSGPIDR